MIKKAVAILIGTSFIVGCSHASSPSSPSSVQPATVSSSSSASSAAPETNSSSRPAQAGLHVGFGFNGVVSGFPTGRVSLTGGGSFDRTTGFVHSGGGFGCLGEVLQGPLSKSINPDSPGPCLTGEGVRWDTAALLPSTAFKCSGAATEALKTAVTGDKTVVLQADFYRAGNGNDESFTAKIIVSEEDIARDFPGANLWVEGVGCGAAQAVNFSK